MGAEMNEKLHEIWSKVQYWALADAEKYIAGRYPYTYAADFLRAHTLVEPDRHGGRVGSGVRARRPRHGRHPRAPRRAARERVDGGAAVMASKRKLWATGFHLIATPKRRHESKASAYRQVENDVRNWLAGALRSQHLGVYVDERDGQGWRVYERIDLAELAACAEAGV